MSWKSVTKEQSWLSEWYEPKSNFEVKCRQVSCEREEILYSIDEFKKHMEDTHQEIASYENEKFEIRYPSSNNWKYFMLWKKIQQPEDPQFAPEMAQYFIKCILCSEIIPYNNESSIENHITKKHSDIENKYREQNIPDFWPWKYQKKFGNFLAQCNHCGICVILELSTESLKKHYEENHKEIWERKFKQEKAHDQLGPFGGPCQSSAERTLQAEFENYSWMKQCFKYQPTLKFHLKCLVKTCNSELLYIIISNFRRHMKKYHYKIFVLEENKNKLLCNSDWKYFMQKEQGEIECLICERTVTDASTNNHVRNHMLQPNRLKNFYDASKKYLLNRSWLWKYLEHAGDFLVKCKLCKKSYISVSFDKMHIKKHYKMHLKQWKAEENTLKQEEARDQAGPSTQPLENIVYKTLESEFEEHSWLKKCYKYQPNPNFRVKCLVNICKDTVLYVDIKNFTEHMQTNHIKICELENKKCSPPDLGVNWKYFRYKEQGEIKCLICETSVTDKSIDNHAQNHMSKDSLHFENCNNINRFNNIVQNWVWKYQRYIGDYIVKCIICEKDSPIIHLTTDTTTLENHYKEKHKTKKKKMKPIWHELQGQAGPSRKLQKTL